MNERPQLDESSKFNKTIQIFYDFWGTSNLELKTKVL